ncbi:MAG: GcrA family cell cycle regulator, partial [Pseudomonadota bacterium]|nr:GcrA family cell cycle regulator [Pseudomonadota bacterium]
TLNVVLLMSWTDEKVNKLKELWGKGQTASQIAEIIGGVSRNAVIGKAHRLGLSSRPSPIKRVNHPITATQERMCQWPIGNPRDPSFHFCGKTAAPDRPYCEEHCAMAYRRKSDNAA